MGSCVSAEPGEGKMGSRAGSKKPDAKAGTAKVNVPGSVFKVPGDYAAGAEGGGADGAPGGPPKAEPRGPTGARPPRPPGGAAGGGGGDADPDADPDAEHNDEEEGEPEQPKRDNTRCPTCKKELVGAESIKVALGHTWHPECYICPKCKKDMRREDPVDKDGYPYHEHCYQELFGAKCDACKETIVGKQMEALEKVFHPACFVCDVCRVQLTGQIHYENGKLYCTKDYVDMYKPRCGGCERPLAGFFIVALDKKFHKDCFTCEKCKKVLNEFEEHDGKAYCEMCDPNRKAFICSICEVDLSGRDYMENLWKEVYCPEHDGLYPRCVSCATMVCQLPEPGQQAICKHCRENIETDSEKMNELRDKVLEDLKKAGLLLPKKFPVRLVPQSKIDQYASKAHKGSNSCTRYDGPDPKEIFVRENMVKEEIESAIAHEIGHIYLNLGGYPQLKPIVEEGICEMFRVKFLEQQLDDDPAAGFGPQMRPDAVERRSRVVENPNMVFGGGYRGLSDGMKSARVDFNKALDIIYDKKWFPS